MSNNLIRKGLAIGATVSLALAGLVGFAAPAQAAGNVYLEPAEGSTYTVPIGANFNLQGYFETAAKRGSEFLKFKVTDAVGNLDLTAGAAGSGFNVAYGTNDNLVAAATNLGTTAGGFATAAQLAAVAGQTYHVVASSVTTAGPAKSFLALVPASGKTATYSVTVQAWMDFDGDNIVDAGEAASEVRTVTWVPASAIVATTTLPTPAVGDTTVASSFKTVPVINGAQLSVTDSVLRTASFSASLTNSRSGTVTNAASAALKWSEANQEFTVLHTLPSASGPATQTVTTRVVTVRLADNAGFATGDTVRVGVDFAGNTTLAVDRALITSQLDDGDITYVNPSLTAGGTVSVTQATVRVVVGDNNYAVTPYYAGTAIGTATAALVGAVTAATAEAGGVVNTNQRVTTSSGNATVQVRSKATSASGTYTVETSLEAPAAGVPVRGTVTTLSNYTGLRINGTTRAQGDTFLVTTNSAGVATVEVTGGTFADNTSIVVTLVAQGVSSTSKTITFDGQNESYKLIDTSGDKSYATGGVSYRSTTTGGSYTFNVALVDQWLQVASATVATHVKATVTSRTTSTSNVALTNGRASITVGDGALNTGHAAVALQGLKIVGATETNVGDNPSTRVYFYNQTDVVNFTSTAAELTAVRTGDETYAVNGASSAVEAWSGGASVSVKGSITNSLSAAAKIGAPITISGPSDVLFSVDSNNVSAYGSLTFWTNDGTFDVKAFSNKVQKDTVITVSSGPASKTVKISFTSSTSEADIKSVQITAAKSIKAGRTTTMTIAIVDKFGSVVAPSAAHNVTVTSSGSGYLTSYPATLVNGQAQVTLVTGAGDFGSSTISVTAGGADNTLSTTTDNRSATASVWVGPVANAFTGVKNGRVKIEAYRAKGKTASVFVGSTRVASFVSDKANFSKSVKVKTGTRNVRVVLRGPGADFRGAIVVK